MKKKNETDTLNETIVLLQNKQAQDLKLLKEQFHLTYETLKPINLIKNTFKEVVSSPDIKNNVFNNLIGITTGFLSKKIVIGSTNNPIKKILGTLFQFAIANVVSKHPDKIKSVGRNFLHSFLKNGHEDQKKFHSNGNP